MNAYDNSELESMNRDTNLLLWIQSYLEVSS